MKYPRKWLLQGPGFIIPVFFLSLSRLGGQVPLLVAPATGLGSSYVTMALSQGAAYNQAGLARIEGKHFVMSHTRPFMLKDLGVSSLSLSVPTRRGTIGSHLNALGMPGLRESSLWLSYGLRLFRDFYAGAGLRVSDWYREELGHQIGLAGALGIQAKLGNSLMCGLHITLPSPMHIAAGLSYSFFKTATWYAEFHFQGEGGLSWAQGLEIKLAKSISLMMGFHATPFSLSAGIQYCMNHLALCLSSSWSLETGASPSFSIDYGW